MKYPPYPEYKQCNAQWLAHLPTHWNAKRLKIEATYCVSNVDKVAGENELPVRLCNYTDVYYNDYIHPDMDLMETTATVDEIRKFGLRVNDVVITKDSEEWSDIAIPAIVTKTAPDFVCGYHLAIIRPNADRLYGPFLLRLLQSSAVNQQFQIAASGVTRYGLPKSAIGEAWLPVPPVEEQEAIARFLDVKTAQIDTLVAKKRQLIEKLKEKRSALIARTVTRGLLLEVAKAAGLEPNPAMKDSGIEWIGDIPNHWITIPYKRLCSRVDVGIAEAATHAYCDDGVPIIRSKNVTPNGIDTSDLMYIEPWFAEKNKSKVLRGGDLVTVRTGYPGTTAVVPAELENCQCFTLVMSSVVRDVYSPFIVYFANSVGMRYFEVEAWGSAQANISVPIVKFLSVAVPPQPEQRAIVAFLDSETTRLDQMSVKVEAAIASLTEYRQALITSAVTGKIDVREAA